MKLIEKDGNTELYYQGNTIFAKHDGKEIRLTGASYSQSKTDPDGYNLGDTGWVPIAAETENDKITMAWSIENLDDNKSLFQAPTFSLETGFINGAHLKDGSWADIGTLTSINPEVIQENNNTQLQTWSEYNNLNAETEFKFSLKKVVSPQSKNNSNEDSTLIKEPSKFQNKFADKITNFSPSTDTLKIDTNSFGIDSSATFTVGKNKKIVKKKLAKQDSDFLYDQKKGGLYFNENGANKGFGEGGIIAILKGSPDLTANNFKFI